MPGAVTDHLQLLLDELHTNQALRADFVANPANAIAPFELTPHERHAVLRRDCDDFVALEVVDSHGDLADLFGCPGAGGGGGIDISDLLDSVRERLEGLLDRVPGIDRPIPPIPPPEPEPFPPPGPGPLPGPRPSPRPGPGPRPGPTPGPDPPDPDRPGPRRRGGADSSPPGD
jgi:hypothetical protein